MTAAIASVITYGGFLALDALVIWRVSRRWRVRLQWTRRSSIRLRESIRPYHGAVL